MQAQVIGNEKQVLWLLIGGEMTYLILRFSSLGNVAMSVPVIASAAKLQPNDEFVVVAKKRLAAMFFQIPNVHFHEADFEHGWRGIHSLMLLYRTLKSNYKIDAVIDLQNVFRTIVLRNLFRKDGAKISVINYGRKEKLLLCWKGHKNAKPLKTEFERYAETMQYIGLKTDDSFTSLAINSEAKQTIAAKYGEKSGKWIGIAPFAKSKTNMLPYKTTKEVIAALEKKAKIFLFGAGEIECEMLHQWASVLPNVITVAGELKLEEELELMRQLDLMLCMDSANQHLASLVNLRAVSVWCGTHPYMGFYGWKQNPDDCLQKNLACRPCTMHGRKQCKYRNFLCKDYTAQQIINKLNI